jgi:hypothetical protein
MTVFRRAVAIAVARRRTGGARKRAYSSLKRQLRSSGQHSIITPVKRSAFAAACMKVLCVAVTVVSIVTGSAPAVAVEVGQPAPDFKLPSSTGGDVSLGDFRGKKWVLLEFYGADFAPT